MTVLPGVAAPGKKRPAMINLLKKEVIDEILKRLKHYGRWLICVHENPDGDTLGCGLAMYSLGLRLGKEVYVTGTSVLPGNYNFLPFSDYYCRKPVLTAGDMTDYTLIICADTSTAERSVGGLRAFIRDDNSINIDHHGDNRRFAGLNVIVPEASATAEIITEIMLRGGFGISGDEAVCLYAALVTDNGGFKFKSTTPHSHHCAAELLEAGVDPAELDDRINRNMTEAVMRLWGKAFCRAELFAGGEAAMFWLDDNDFKSAGADSSAVDGLVNSLMRIKDVKIALLLTVFDGAPKLSVRTRGIYSAREIAAAWGGGGHPQAAGAKLELSFEEAKTAVKGMVDKYVTDGIIAAQ